METRSKKKQQKQQLVVSQYSSIVKTYIQPSRIKGANNGLFACCNIKMNQEVVRILNPLFMTTESQIKNYVKIQKNASDCVIFIGFVHKQLKNAWIGDTQYVKDQHWYYLNHATVDANVKPIFNNIEKTIVWYAKRDIAKEDELYFNYNPGVAVYFLK